MLILIECVRSLKRIDWIDQSVVSFVILTFSPRGPIQTSLLSTKIRHTIMRTLVAFQAVVVKETSSLPRRSHLLFGRGKRHGRGAMVIKVAQQQQQQQQMHSSSPPDLAKLNELFPSSEAYYQSVSYTHLTLPTILLV